MDTRVCGYCGGTGEVWVLRFSGSQSDADELVPCSACHGKGQVPLEPVRLKPSRPAPRYKRGQSPAMKAAVAAIEKHFPKKKKR